MGSCYLMLATNLPALVPWRSNLSSEQVHKAGLDLPAFSALMVARASIVHLPGEIASMTCSGHLGDCEAQSKIH
jgi:hypothetical protein